MFLTQSKVYWEYTIAGTNLKLVYNFKKKYLLVYDEVQKKTIKALDDVFLLSLKEFEVEGQLYFLSYLRQNYGVN